MKIKDFNNAKGLVEELKAVDNAVINLDKADKIAVDEAYWATISQHDDGSGWSVSLNGTAPAIDYIQAIREVLVMKKQDIEKAIEEI